MSDFVFPSDQDRADDDELDRVCCELEEQMASKTDDKAAKLAGAITDAAVKAGGVEPGIELSGPQLLMAVNDMAETIINLQRKADSSSETPIHQIAKQYLNEGQQERFMGEIREMLYGHPRRPLSESEIHKAAKRYLSKRQQGYFMGEIREALYGHNDRVVRPASDCCCGETEEIWRLCPQHKHITGEEQGEEV